MRVRRPRAERVRAMVSLSVSLSPVRVFAPTHSVRRVSGLVCASDVCVNARSVVGGFVAAAVDVYEMLALCAVLWLWSSSF